MGGTTSQDQEEKAGSVKMFLGISVVSFVVALVVFVLMVTGVTSKIQKSTRTKLAGTILDPAYKPKTQQLQEQLAQKQAELEATPKTVAGIREAEAKWQAETTEKIKEAEQALAEQRQLGRLTGNYKPTWGEYAKSWMPTFRGY